MPDSQNPYASPAISTDAELASPSPNRPDQPLVQPIRISGELSREDYYMGLKMGSTFLVSRFLLLIIMFSGCPILGVCVYVLVGDLLRAEILILLMISFVLAVIFLFRWRIKRQDGKSFIARKGPFQYEEVLISETGMEARTQFGTWTSVWQAFGKYRHNDRVAVLHFEGYPRLFRLFPRSKFQTPEDWECFLGLLKRKMQQG